MNASRFYALALMVLLTAACGGQESHWAGTMIDSAGIAIVANPEEGVWGPGDEWTFEEELRIGALEGDPQYQFGQVASLTVDSDGQIYVMDLQAQHIQVYSPEGEYVRTIGSRGGGPGEMLQGVFVLMGPGDTILVPDIQNQRVNRYAPDGSSLGSFRIEIEKGLPMVWAATRTGAIAEQVRPFALPGQPALENPEDAIVMINMDGTVADTLMKFPSGGTLNLGGAAPEINIYSPEPAWDLTDDLRLAFGVNDDYRITFYSSDGTLERIVTKPFERQPVAERDREAVMNALERAWTDAGVPAEAMGRLRGMIHFGEFFPAFASFTSGPAGTLLVQHVRPASTLSEEEYASFNPIEDAGAPDWDVFDSQGRYLGVVTMPHRFTPRFFRDDKVYGVWRDELDVQYVLRLRVIGDITEGAT